MIKILNFDLYPFFLIKDKKILAYSLHYSEEKSINHLEKIKEYHNLEGEIKKDKKLEKWLENRINGFINGKKYSFDLRIYKHKQVYEFLLRTKKGKTTTYSAIYKATGIKMNEIIMALARNPFLILIPCHRIIRKDGKISGYTPLGKKFKEELLKAEGLDIKTLNNL